MILRPARAMDMVKFTKYVLPRHFSGIVCEEDGEVIGLGAIIVGDLGRPWVVLDMTERMRHKKVTLHRVGRQIVKAGLQVFDAVYVLQSQTEPTAKRWLERLGFKETGELHRGEIVMRATGE